MRARILYLGAMYQELPELPAKDLYSYDEIRSRGATEAGDVTDPDGEWHPGWADLGGDKYAEVDGGYLRIDNKPGWVWSWSEGVGQEDLLGFLGNERFVI